MEFDFSKQPGLEWKKRSAAQGSALMTIVTPFYNAGKYFEQTFYSVMNQTFPWFEWIIVDDGSDRKEDLDILERFSKKDERVSVVRQANRGLACARNTGIQKAATDIIVPLDADDLISPQYLEYVYFGLYFHAEAAWCYTDSVGFGQQEYLWRHPWNAGKLKKDNFLVATAAIRKQAVNRVGGYKAERQPYYEDWRFWLELLAGHEYPVHLKGYLFWYRRSGEGMLSGIHSDRRKKRASRRIIKEAAKRACNSIKAVEYPVKRTAEPYWQSQFRDFWKDYRISSKKGKIKILMLIPWMVMGGADRFNLELVSGLDKSRFQISIITTVPSENEWHTFFAEYTDEIFHLPDFLDPAHYMEYVSWYIQTRDIDILFISNSYQGYYMIPWLRKQFPGLCIIDYVHMEEWYWKAGGFARLSGVFGSFLDKTYVCSSAAKETLAGIFKRDPKSVLVMHIGVDEQRFHPEKVEKGKLYKRLGISKERPVVLFPCRIDPQKRPFLMLNIAERISRQMPQVMFVAAGEGPQKQELESAVKKRGLGRNVVCIGSSDYIEECYQDAKITLICSIKEGLSLTAYESCAMETPVVSSDVGGQKDLIDHTVGMLIPLRQSEAADFDERIFPEEEIDDYVRGIIKLLSDEELYEMCSANCRKKIENGFTVKNMLENMGQELISLMEDESRSRKRREMSASANSLGFLAEEIYTLELAEEERSTASAAVLSMIEKAVSILLPQGGRRRDAAVRLYRKWR